MNQTAKVTLATLILSALTACSSGGGSGSSDGTTANSNTSSNTTVSTTSQPGSSANNTTSESDTSTTNNTTSQPDTSTTNNTTSQPDTSTTNNTTSQPDTSTTNNTTSQPDTSTTNNTTSQPDTSTTNNTTSQPDTSTTDATSQPTTPEFTGYAFSYNAKLGKPTNPGPTITINSDSIDTIVVNGKSYSLIPNLTGISGGSVNISTIWQSDDTKIVCCGTKTDIKSVKIGAVLDNETLYTFVQGKPTPEDQIPTAGRVVYQGNGTAKLINLSDQDNKGFQNSSLSTHIDADFDNKNVSGYLYDGSQKFFDITDGKINGNDITNGKVSLTVQDEDNKQALNIDNNAQFSAPLNAKFYGENAKEVAGTAHNEKWGVIFAASKSE
ncbi:transferrin-binding protein-like solute binding protein [Avibacterium sp. 21-586]|uniref:transferrin-binding protein-like solute binding protein n=1 Tax=Avibacterium sp. 21-586 TaxID=2911534 RepID=UPI002248324E|nr:transferrin-binding protein-like solute binding protein [Avibacterium sp. 21-586]MCW9709872.1 transferrin-binding protein-like solute binding protein [Avibacterium sp. 21-586]